MRIVKHIPNSITSMNLLSGVIGVIFTLEGRIDIAFLLMLLSMAFDFCDGLAARLLKAESKIGLELDSLADVVSFGVLPSLMLFKTAGSQVCPTSAYLTLVLAAFSALRLAKFNLDERQHDGFIGLPTPSAAIICGSLTYYVQSTPEGCLSQLCSTCWFLPLVAIVLSALLVCEIPMFSLKFGKGKPSDKKANLKRVIYALMLIPACIAVIICKCNWSMILLLAFCIYPLANIIFAVIPALKQEA